MFGTIYNLKPIGAYTVYYQGYLLYYEPETKAFYYYKSVSDGESKKTIVTLEELKNS